MSFVSTGVTAGGYPIYRDTTDGECYTFEDGVFVYYGQCPANTPLNSPPNFPTTINTQGGVIGGVPIQSGHSWFEDLLNSFITLGAIGAGAQHIPTTAQQPLSTGGMTYAQQQQYLQQYQQQYQQQNAGGQFGASLQNFIQKNFTLIALGAGALVLWKSGRK